LGSWVYVFYETGTTQLTNGTFEVGPSAESLLTEQIAALSEELGIDIDTLRTVIDDLGIDMDDAVSMMAEDIAAAVSGMKDDISDLSEDFDDAVTGMQDDLDDMGDQMTGLDSMMNNLADSTTNAQEAANDAKISADQATEAAEANQQATSGLTTLVYGAIGASLIAALAAIVSLMQISRRIAG
jgi:methyl-accepting chemotaxis protein